MRTFPRIAGVPLTPQSMKSLSQGIIDFSRGRFAPPLIVKERIRICESCPYGGKRCSFCGCFIKTKASLLNSSCPANKWLDIDTSIDSGKHQDATKKTDKIE